jgi:hypothetical protein
MSTKPPWDESLPGTHPAFKKPTKDEIEGARKALAEARQLSTGMGAREMTAKQHWLEGARSREELHRLNLLYFENAKPKEVGGSKTKTTQIQHHRFGLVAVLRDLGRFHEALELASTVVGKARKTRPGFGPLVDRVYEMGMAVALDDFALDTCGCSRPVFAVQVSERKAVDVALPRRHKVGLIFSIPHGKVVDLWRCGVCGMLNAHDLGPPEAQAELHELRHQAELAERGRLGRNRVAKDHAAHADHLLFKAFP